MTTITISLADDQLAKLQEKADRIGVSPEELARASIADLLNRPEEDLKRNGTSDLVLGAFGDDPALIDQVTDDAIRAREAPVLRQAG